MCEQVVPGFGMSKTETFSNSIDLVLISQYDKGAVMQISTVVRHIYLVAYQRIISNGSF